MTRVLKLYRFDHGGSERVGGDYVAKPYVVSAETTDSTNRLIAEAQAVAGEIVAAAREEAQTMIDGSRQSALQQELDAYEQGKIEGYEAGRIEAMHSMDRIVAIAENAAVEWEESVHALERQVIELAVAVAQRVVSRITEDDTQMVLTSIMQALDHLADSPTVTIRVSPADEPMVSQHWAETRGRTYRDRVWDIVADRTIEPGGCILELANGTIDAQVSTQFAEIHQSMLAAGGFDAGAA